MIDINGSIGDATMPKDTPSMAKNKMTRCFAAILDPHPSDGEKEKLWRYFKSQCAYCGKRLTRSKRNAHLDHIVPSSEGGTNSIYNHVLSCATCNGDEKRDQNWESFLRDKSKDESIFRGRKKLIDEWRARQPDKIKLPKALKKQADEVVKDAISTFESAVDRLRSIRNASSK